MTANQIAFYKASTEAEHYRRSDDESIRHNKETEGLGRDTLAETHWMNQMTAGHYIRQDAETQRHNVAQEAIQSETNTINAMYHLWDYQVKRYANETDRNYKYGMLANNSISTLDQSRKIDSEIALNTSKVDVNTSEIGLNNAKVLNVNTDTELKSAETDLTLVKQKVAKSEIARNVANALLSKEQVSTEGTKQFLNTAKGFESYSKVGVNISNIINNSLHMVPLIGRLIS